MIQIIPEVVNVKKPYIKSGLAPQRLWQLLGYKERQKGIS